MNLILFGPPGVGKGTQATLISKAYSLHLLSTGVILREEVAKNSDLGKEVKGFLDQGLFAGDDLIMDVVESAMSSVDKTLPDNKGFIFDGVPRTLFQAQRLEEILRKRQEKIDLAFFLDVNKEALVARLKGRYTCAQCGAGYNDVSHQPQKEGVCDTCGSTHFARRSDDEEETIRVRLKIYKEKTASAVSFYKEKGVLHEINGMQTPEEVYASLESILSKIVRKA